MTDAEKTLFQDNIINKISGKLHGRFLLAPRIGKTRIVLTHLVLSPTNIKKVLFVTLDKHLAKTLLQEQIKWGAINLEITVTTWSSLHNMVGEYDIFVFDEDQKITDRALTNIRSGKLDSKFGIFSMTGTPTYDKDKLKLFKELNLSVEYEITIDEAVEIGLISDYKINILMVDFSTKPDYTIQYQKKSYTTTEKARYMQLNKLAEMAIMKPTKNSFFNIMNRFKFIATCPTKTAIAKKLVESLGGRKLIFCSDINQAEIISENVFHSKTDDRHLIDFVENRTQELALVDKGGTGYTYEKIDNLIIVQASSDNNGDTTQKITRTLLKQGDYCANIWIICMRDSKDEDWVSNLLKRFNKEKVNYLEYGN